VQPQDATSATTLRERLLALNIPSPLVVVNHLVRRPSTARQ
jgi:hypothetical protein